jgi:hypothetical protein
MTLHSQLSFPASEAVAALARDAAEHPASDVARAPEPLDPDTLANTLHDLRDLLAPVVQCAAILRMSSARSARVDRTSEVLARNVRAVQRLLDELDTGRASGRRLQRS